MSARNGAWALLDILELPLGATILQQLGCPGACEALPGVSCGAKRLRLRMVCHSDLMCPLGLGGGNTHVCCLVSGCGFRVPRGVRAHMLIQSHMQSCPHWMVRDHGRFWVRRGRSSDEISFTRPELSSLHARIAADDDALASRWSNQSTGAALLAGAVKCPASQCGHSGSLSSILEHVATCSLAQRRHRIIDLFEGAFHAGWSRASHFLDEEGTLRHENTGPWRSYFRCKICTCRVSDRYYHALRCNLKKKKTRASMRAERNQDCSRNYQRCPMCDLWVNTNDVELKQAEPTTTMEAQEQSRSITQVGGLVGAAIGAVPGSAPGLFIGGIVGATVGAMQGAFAGDSYWNTLIESAKKGARLGGSAGIVVTSPLIVAGCAAGGLIGVVGDVALFTASSS